MYLKFIQVRQSTGEELRIIDCSVPIEVYLIDNLLQFVFFYLYMHFLKSLVQLLRGYRP